MKIGDNNLLESKCRVGRQTELTNGCVVGTGCQIETEEVLPENMAIFAGNQRRQLKDRPQSQALQIDYLAKTLHNYHHLKKATKKQ